MSISTCALREEGDRPVQARKCPPTEISIPALREEGDRGNSSFWLATANFYPRPPRGGRLPLCAGCKTTEKFLSTPSARRATRSSYRSYGTAWQFLSTPSARRATHKGLHSGRLQIISIPALREEGDRKCLPREKAVIRFLSTPSARRATAPDCFAPVRQTISIHALREEGDLFVTDRFSYRQISIHALREEGDKPYLKWDEVGFNFYPRPPRGGRLSDGCSFSSSMPISIHALREEGDRWATGRTSSSLYFYPRPPRGGRPFVAQGQAAKL